MFVRLRVGGGGRSLFFCRVSCEVGLSCEECAGVVRKFVKPCSNQPSWLPSGTRAPTEASEVETDMDSTAGYSDDFCADADYSDSFEDADAS